MVSKQDAEKIAEIITSEIYKGHMTEEMFLRGLTLQDFNDCMAIIRAHFSHYDPGTLRFPVNGRDDG